MTTQAPAAPAASRPVVGQRITSLPGQEGNLRGPQRFAPITSRLTQIEASQAHKNQYKPPTWMEGETVWYRARHARDETLAVILQQTGKKFLIQMIEGQRRGKVSNVCYFDPSFPQLSDPLAAHNEKGTFRKTPFAHLVYTLTTGGGSVEVTHHGLEARLDDVERKLQQVPNANSVETTQRTINELSKRLTDLSDAMGQLTATPKGQDLMDLRQKVEHLEAGFVDFVRQYGGEVVGDPPPPEDEAKDKKRK